MAMGKLTLNDIETKSVTNDRGAHAIAGLDTVETGTKCLKCHRSQIENGRQRSRQGNRPGRSESRWAAGGGQRCENPFHNKGDA